MIYNSIKFKCSETKYITIFSLYFYHIYKNYGMTHQINELELKNIIESLSEVVEVKEILMIQKD